NRSTVTKVRLLGASDDKSTQQMMRLDFEESSPVDASVEARLIEQVDHALAGCDVLCIEDYNKGVVTPAVAQHAIRAARASGKQVLVDPPRLNDYSRFTGATAVKFNRPEAERAAGMTINSPEQWAAAAEVLLAKLQLDAVVITLNDLGSYLATASGERELIVGRKRQVADATGAGDMVLVALTLARAAGANWREAVALGNVLGGLEVERLGCVPISREETLRELLLEAKQHLGKQRALKELVPELQQHRRAGRRIVFTNGCFDLIHLGHVQYFRFAKAQGDVLVVGVNTDAGIRRIK